MKKKAHLLNDIAAQLYKSIPKNIRDAKKDLEKNFHGILMGAFSKLELVTREEFDAQTKVLARTRKKLESIETELKNIEKELKDKK